MRNEFMKLLILLVTSKQMIAVLSTLTALTDDTAITLILVLGTIYLSFKQSLCCFSINTNSADHKQFKQTGLITA